MLCVDVDDGDGDPGNRQSADWTVDDFERNQPPTNLFDASATAAFPKFRDSENATVADASDNGST